MSISWRSTAPPKAAEALRVPSSSSEASSLSSRDDAEPRASTTSSMTAEAFSVPSSFSDSSSLSSSEPMEPRAAATSPATGVTAATTSATVATGFEAEGELMALKASASSPETSETSRSAVTSLPEYSRWVRSISFGPGFCGSAASVISAAPAAISTRASSMAGSAGGIVTTSRW